MIKNKFSFVITALILCLSASAQTEEFFMNGVLPDDGTYEILSRKADLLTRDYASIPRRHSLMQYCPEVKSQGIYSTCTSWATAYAARTIAEAVKNDWTDKKTITREAFSPLFVYAQIKDRQRYPYDNNCQQGTHIYKALELMKGKGVPKFSDFGVLCADQVHPDLFRSAALFKIDDFFTLFSINCHDENEKILKVKKSLSEDCPVVIAMHLPESFRQAGNLWDGSDINPAKHGYHAMCVIGYDDDRAGGSFQIMNSWGLSWGENGFVWVRYQDFAKYVDQAYEIYVKKNPRPQPVFINKPLTINYLSGSIELQLTSGEKMIPVLGETHGMYHYRIAGEYISRTRYRVYISNDEPAYVYVIGSDLNNNVSKVFPLDRMSAALTYKSNHIAIPDETYFIEMDDTRGKDYMCLLYSKEELDIDNIIRQVENASGSFYDKIKYALGDKIVPQSDLRYIMNEIGFSAKTDRSVVPLIVEINHQ